MPTWIRVRDCDTGHEYDLHEDDPRLAGSAVEVLKDYPPNSSSTAQPRPPKHRVDKAGQPVVDEVEGDQEPDTDEPMVDGQEPTADESSADGQTPPADDPPAAEAPAGDPPADGQEPPADEQPGVEPADDKTTAGTSAKKRRSN